MKPIDLKPPKTSLPRWENEGGQVRPDPDDPLDRKERQQAEHHNKKRQKAEAQDLAIDEAIRENIRLHGA